MSVTTNVTCDSVRFLMAVAIASLFYLFIIDKNSVGFIPSNT
jgi:hypothetical protein